MRATCQRLSCRLRGGSLLAIAGIITAITAVAGTTGTASAAINSCTGTGMSFDGGAGTTAAPYLVSTEAQLEALNNSSYPTCAFRQSQDIALTTNWGVIGSSYASRFRGEYDGDGHLIRNLNVDQSANSYKGLFGYTVGATIKNLRVSGEVDIPDGFGNGALIGLADTGTRVENVHSSVNVTSGARVGGLIGWAAEVTVSRSSSTGNVTGTDNSVGGLIGYARGNSLGLTTSVSDSYATGSVTGAAGYRGIAGLIGAVDGSAPGVRITNSYSAGSVTGGTGTRQECPDPTDPSSCYTVVGTTGGLVALDYDGSPYGSVLGVTDSFWDTQTSARATTADNKGTGKTTAEMKNIATFTGASWDIAEGWDASKTWGICDGSTYPFLTGQYTASPCAAPSPTPTPDPSPSPTPTPDPSPSPTPEPGPGPTPGPSNAFTMRTPRAIGSTVVATVRLPGPGTVVLTATRSRSAAAQTTACRSSRTVSRTRAVVLRCTADPATRSVQRRRDVRLRVTVTYTPTGGTPRRSAPRLVTLKRLKAAFTG